MNVVNIAHLKNNLSRHLARVRRGGEITVYDRDTPVARIVPFVPGATPATPGATDTADRVADLVRQGVLSPGDPRAVASWLETRRPIQLPVGSPGAVEVLVEMRRKSTR